MGYQCFSGFDGSENVLHIPLVVFKLLLSSPGLTELLCYLMSLEGLHLSFPSHLLQVSCDDLGAYLEFILTVLFR